MNLLVFGGGFVGGSVAAAALARGWRVCVAATSIRPGLPGARWRIADITQEEAVEAAIVAEGPQAVVNAAAMSGIDRAEVEQELAWRVNVEGARHVVQSSARHGIRHIFFSSDAVFDGEGGPYREEDAPSPVNYYGHTKAAAERAVLEADPRAIVLRVSLVLGYPVTGGNSYFARLEERLAAGQEAPSPANEIRTPVDVVTLSECVLELAEGDLAGILHVAGTEWASRYELARRAAAAMGYAQALVRPEPPQPGRAPRHRNGMLSVARAQRTLRTRLPALDEGIARCIAARRQGPAGGNA